MTRDDRVIYTRHARTRQEGRRISDSEVEAVVEDFHTSYKDKDGNDVRIGHPGGRRIKVVVARGSEPPRIITVAD